MTRDGGAGEAGGRMKDGRDERLARRLRENLRRRKAQVKARRETGDVPEGDSDPAAEGLRSDEQD